MRVAVLTLTRDRLEITRHCFAKLREFAGCAFDHYVLDQGSQDGTAAWLLEEYDGHVTVLDENIGISPGMNLLLDEADLHRFDVIIKADNDLELTQPNTIRDIAWLAHTGGCLLSPKIRGLLHPPTPTGRLRIGDETILNIEQIGGICLAAPAWVYDEFRYSDNNPPWGMDDVEICAWFRAQGGTCGYVERLEAWHYMGTEGQEQRFPDYFDRKYAEMGLARA